MPGATAPSQLKTNGCNNGASSSTKSPLRLILDGLKAGEQDLVDEEAAQPLLQDSDHLGSSSRALAKLQYAGMPTKTNNCELVKACCRTFDVFKGVLVVLMTYAHVDLCLLSPVLQYYAEVPHMVGNMASGLCFLGFMLSYGFTCDIAYLSDTKDRPWSEKLNRVARSVMLPICAAWICSLAWGFMCFKLPIDMNGLIMILDFRLAIGNGPDFLLCFPICLMVMYPFRHIVNNELTSSWTYRRAACAAVMLFVPLGFTRCVVWDCTGLRKYMNYFLECTNREPYAPNLPALPHLFYFNLGVLLSRWVQDIAKAVQCGWIPSWWRLGAAHAATTIGLSLLAYPLATVWSSSYGNIMVVTKWGPITRGFINGPSVLWLLGNICGLELLFSICAGMVYVTTHWRHSYLISPLRLLQHELSHLGANVLLYLVVADICLAGLFRGMQGQYPLGSAGGAVATFIILLATRFVHYLAASSRAVEESS